MHVRLSDGTAAQVGQDVYWWVWTGGERQGQVYGTIVRINRKTVTVDTEYNGRQRIDPADLSPDTMGVYAEIRERRAAGERNDGHAIDR
jgi:hypothetical protein